VVKTKKTKSFCIEISVILFFSTIIIKSIVNSLILSFNTRISSILPETTLKVKGWKCTDPNDDDIPN